MRTGRFVFAAVLALSGLAESPAWAQEAVESESRGAMVEVIDALGRWNLQTGDIAILFAGSIMLMAVLGWAIAKCIRTLRGESSATAEVMDRLAALEDRLAKIEKSTSK